MADIVAETVERMRKHSGPRAKLHNPWREKGVSDENLAAMTKPHLDLLDVRASTLAKDIERAFKPIS